MAAMWGLKFRRNEATAELAEEALLVGVLAQVTHDDVPPGGAVMVVRGRRQ